MVFSLYASGSISHPSCSSKMTLTFLHQQMEPNSHPLASSLTSVTYLTIECCGNKILGPLRLDYRRPSHFIWVSCSIPVGAQPACGQKPKHLERLWQRYLLNSPSCQPASPASRRSEPPWMSGPIGPSDACAPANI